MLAVLLNCSAERAYLVSLLSKYCGKLLCLPCTVVIVLSVSYVGCRVISNTMLLHSGTTGFETV